MSKFKRFGLVIVGMLVFSLIPSFVGRAAAFNIPNGDVAALIAAINQANASAGKDEINLAPNGIYTFKEADNEVLDVVLYSPVLLGANALPQISSNITINGNGATLQRDPIFSTCNASNELRMFWVNGNGKLTLNNVNFKNNCVGESGTGGAIYVWKGGVVNIVGGTFDNNHVTGIVLGGGAVGADDSYVFVDGANFTNNSSTYQGGAVYLESSTGVFLNSNFTGNTNPSQGGAIAGITNADVAIYGGTFTGNSANHAGAVATSDGGKLYIAGSTMISNSAYYVGGAISNDKSTLTVRGATFSNNISGQSGGAISTDGTNKTYVSDSTFTSNTATRYGGGAISVGGGDFYAFNTSFVDNKSLDVGGWGGGFLNNSFGSVTLVNVTATGNSATGYGGGINTSGTKLSITGSTFTDNAGTYGGGVYGSVTDITIHTSTFSGNDATEGFGGAVYTQNDLQIFNSTFSGNSATGVGPYGDLGGGGAIFSSSYFSDPASSMVVNSTFSGNSTPKDGGAIYADGVNAVTLSNVTMTGNSAVGNGSGVFNGLDEGAAAPVLTRSIVLGNAGGDCDGAVTSSGNNVIGSGCSQSGNDQNAANPAAVLNTTLANNGGATETHALTANSPAIDLGGTGCTAGDQRGFARSGACDAGAFEHNGAAASLPGVTVAQSGGSTAVAENGVGDSYTIALGSAPTGIVNVTILSDGQLSASPSTLVFTQANWSTPQTVNVSANVDQLIESQHTGKLFHVFTSTDISYNGVPSEVLVAAISADSTGGGDTPTDVPVTPEPAGELTDNGNFEQNGVWAVKKATKDKVKCNRDGKIFAHTGACAFLFKGGANEKSQISQKLTSLNLQAGDTLTLSAWVAGKKTVKGGSIKVRVVYADSTVGKLNLNINTGSYSYTQLTHPAFALTQPASEVRLMVKNKSASGQFLIDDVSLVHTPANGGFSNNQLLDLPLPETGMSGRGQ